MLSIHPEEIVFVIAGFTERGVITAILFIFGLGRLVAGRRYTRTLPAGAACAQR
ncbi:MAG: hypothetical protein U1E36_04575 [Rickettsiales bacterium]